MKKLAWVFCFLPMFSGCDFEERMPIEMATTTQAQPLGKEASLEATVRFDIGSLEIISTGHSGSLYSYDLEYDKAASSPDIHYDSAFNGTEGRFFFGLRSIHTLGIHPRRYNNKLRLSLSDSIPVKLKVNAGIGDSRLSLSGMKLSQIDFESGVGEATISAYEPNAIPCEYIRLKNGVGRLEAIGLGNLNFRRFEFDGGVGGANLDFTGGWEQNADIHIQVGVGGVNIRMPREIGVKVEAAKNFLSGLHLEGFNQQNSFYYSENYNKAAIRVSINVTTGIGGLRFTWL